jgi:hypothetical protein
MGIKNDIGPDGHNWLRWPFRNDPITGRKICRDCWDGEHSTTENAQEGYQVCRVDRCKCACRESPAAQKEERRAKRKAAKERRQLQREMLENSPLRAVNPAFREKIHGRPHA